MENTQQKISPNMYCAKHGAIVGAVLILLAMIFYSMNGKLNDSESYAGTANTVMLVLGLFFFARKYKTDFSLTFFSYGNAFKISFLIGLYASILVAFFYYLFYKVSPEALNLLLIDYQNAYQATGLYSADELESMMKLLQRFMSPGLMALGSLFGFVIQVTIFSLIVSLFLYRSTPAGQAGTSAFDRDMSKLNE
jgi:hypothetical protein